VAEYAYQFKFVVDSPADAADVLRYLDEFPEIDRGRAMLMPQGIDAATLAAHEPWVTQFCQSHGLAYCPRRHIEWFGLVRGT
jgi:7-carboxy-7-deazaguanine synthase